MAQKNIFICLIMLFLNANGEARADFRISTEPSPSQFIQANPELFPSPNGDFLVTWQDNRLGEFSAFAQRFDANARPIGGNFQIVGNQEITFLKDGTGLGIGIVDQDGYYNIYGQIIDPEGSLSTPFFIDRKIKPDGIQEWPIFETRLIALKNEFLLGINRAGNISLKKINGNGHIICESDAQLQLPEQAFTFSLAGNHLNQFVLLWFEMGADSSANGVCASFFNENTEIIQDTEIVQNYDFKHSYFHYQGVISVRSLAISDSVYQFFWADADSMVLKYACYRQNGAKMGSICKIDQFPPLYGEAQSIKNFSLTNYPDHSFHLLVTLMQYLPVPTMPWPERCATFKGTFANNGILLNHQFFYSDLPGVGENLLFFDPDTITFGMQYSWDIFLFNLRDSTISQGLKINDDQMGANQVFPRVFIRDSSKFFVTWQDTSGYYGRTVDFSGRLLDKEVNLKSDDIIFLTSSVAVNLWKQPLSNYQSAVGLTWYDAALWQPIRNEELDKGGSGEAWIRGMKISDSSLVIYLKKYFESQLIIYDFTGEKIQEIKFSHLFDRSNPTLLPGSAQTFWILSEKFSYLFSNKLELLSSLTDSKLRPPIQYIGTGLFLKLDARNGIFAEILDTTGIKKNAFSISDCQYPNNLNLVCLDSARFLALWSKEKEIFAQSFSITGELLTDVLVVHDIVESSRNWPNACTNNGQVLFVWSDTRNWGNGYDIYGNIFDLDKVMSIKEKTISNSAPNHYTLLQNFPNPFTIGTLIFYELAESEFVKISIYNTLGKHELTIVSETKRPGLHTVAWNGLDDSGQALPSGVYFCRMQAGNTLRTRKMILLR